jgi:hypothetical protein
MQANIGNVAKYRNPWRNLKKGNFYFESEEAKHSGLVYAKAQMLKKLFLKTILRGRCVNPPFIFW